jgi:hypothetical protein
MSMPTQVVGSQEPEASEHEPAVKVGPRLGTIVDPGEHFLCPRCLSSIPRTCVWPQDLREQGTNRPYRMIRVLCDHCNKGFEAPCGYVMGSLRPMKPAEEIRDMRVLEQLKKRVDHNRGVIQNSKR